MTDNPEAGIVNIGMGGKCGERRMKMAMQTRTKHRAKVVREGKIEEEKGIKIGALTKEVAKLIEPEGAVKTGESIATEVLQGKEVILAVLERAAEESEFLARLADDPSEALAEYYTLTSEERAALASGDIKKIEGWVGKLDKRLATWLWCRLSQEKW
ncbi:hypothetical protein ES707_09878 [subsurface metagenome]